MEAARQPVTFENPLYATAPGVPGDPAVIHATQVRSLLNKDRVFAGHHFSMKYSGYIHSLPTSLGTPLLQSSAMKSTFTSL